MLTTPNLGLIAWNFATDAYDSEELAENWIKVDLHDHSPGKGVLIDTPSLADEAITAAKLHPDAVPDFVVADASITNAKLATDAVTATKIATDAVTASEIAAGAVANAELGANAVDRSKTIKSFIQGKRTTVSSANTITITWDVSFGDTNYTVIAMAQSATHVHARINSLSATQVTFGTGANWSGTLHAIGIHD